MSFERELSSCLWQVEIRNNEVNLKAIREVNVMVNKNKILDDIYQLLLPVLIYIIDILA